MGFVARVACCRLRLISSTYSLCRDQLHQLFHYIPGADSPTHSDFSGAYGDDLHVSVQKIAAELLSSLGFDGPALLNEANLQLSGSREPFLPCPLRVTDGMTALHVAIAVLSDLFAQARSPKAQNQRIAIDVDTATMQFFSCMAFEWFARPGFPSLSGGPEKPLMWREATPAQQGFPQVDAAKRFGDIYWQLYQCGDGRWVFLSPYVNPYPVDGLLKLVGFNDSEVPEFMKLLEKEENTDRAIAMMQTACRRVPSARALEKEMFEKKAGGCWAIKSLPEFLDSEQGEWCRNKGQIHIDKVDGWEPAGFGEDLKEGDGPYKGLKVVEITRIVMGVGCFLWFAMMNAG